MAGTDSTYIGMPMASGSISTVGKNTGESNRGNPNGDVVDNSASDNLLSDNGLRTDPADARGAYLNRQSKAPEIQ